MTGTSTEGMALVLLHVLAYVFLASKSLDFPSLIGAGMQCRDSSIAATGAGPCHVF